ncbi:MAG: RsmD family RNA methyltransferase [Phycisphaerales bacterium]|nr:RsmD family RNA methyltransferase [Phycisphaerales bacterium]
MRIIAGEFRSRKLLSPPDAEITRPIPDRVKESLFGLLRGHIEGSMVFDGFAGSGAFGLEALSRGAARCTFVERDRTAADLLRRNIENLGVEDRAELVVGDALGPGALARCPRPATIVFLDPPYPLVRDPIGWKRTRIQLERLIACLGEDAFGIIRTPWPFVHMVNPDLPAGQLGPDSADGDSAFAPHAADRKAGGRGGRGGRGRDDRRKGGRSEHARSERVRTGRLRDSEVEIWSIENDPHGNPHNPHPPPDKSLADLTEEEIDKLDAQDQEASELKAQAPKLQRIDPDLTIPGAIGPETHEYGTMAVHLYQRAR